MKDPTLQLETLPVEVCREILTLVDHRTYDRKSFRALIHASPRYRYIYLDERQRIHGKIAPEYLRIATFENIISKEPVHSNIGYHIVRSTHNSVEIERHFRCFGRGEKLDSAQLQIFTITEFQNMAQRQETIDFLTSGFQIWLGGENEAWRNIAIPWTELRAQRIFYAYEIFMILFRDDVLNSGDYFRVLGIFQDTRYTDHRTRSSLNKERERLQTSICTWLELEDIHVVAQYVEACYRRLLAKIKEYLKQEPDKRKEGDEDPCNA